LDKFNECTLGAGNETAANLHAVKQRLITFFAPREVLRQQRRCIRFHMRKPKEEKPRKKAKTSSYHNTRERSEFCCEEHGPNPTHNTSACKVFLNHGGKDNWKKKDASESKYSDYKSKHKKRHAELNLLQKETKKEKAKWTKACKNLKSKEANNGTGKESESSNSKADKKSTAKTQTRPDKTAMAQCRLYRQRHPSWGKTCRASSVMTLGNTRPAKRTEKPKQRSLRL
jgi:hypothetical protein